VLPRQAATPIISPALLIIVNIAALAGLDARLVVKVNVARLFVELYETPPGAIVYVPATPAIVKVVPSAGEVYRLPTISVVPVCPLPCTLGVPYEGTLAVSYLAKPSTLR
jgi:hypothetical protein